MSQLDMEELSLTVRTCDTAKVQCEEVGKCSEVGKMINTFL